MKKLVLVPNKMGSKAARGLADTLSGILNYKVFRVTPNRVRNRTPFVLTPGTDKLTQFNTFKSNEIQTPEYTTDRAVALAWVRDGTTVFCRTLLRASEGRGIVVATNEQELVAAPLYTKYFKKKREFRVHVLHGMVIDVQEKRKKAGVEERDTRIRNVANGYVFCRDNVVEPQGLRDLAIKATTALKYSLGAVDIAYNEHYNQLVVLEVNANPGMTGTTLINYANAIVRWFRGQ